MPPSVPAPARRVPVEKLTPAVFSPFGTVVENPMRTGSPPPGDGLQTVTANQGTALKYLDVTHMTNFYHMAASRKPGRAVMNMFVCSPRKLRSSGPADPQMFDISILERHPFTSQTFIPMGLSASDASTQYLVIVAPTLPVSTKHQQKRPPPFPAPEPRKRRSIRGIFSRARPSPFDNEAAPPSPAATRGSKKSTSVQPPKGPGMPDLANARAFIARGDQAVTYAAGTWHAPMCVLGADDIDFVVVQFANGVGIEDCQEVELMAAEGAEGLAVSLGEHHVPGMVVKAKL
ncbi:Ureidoglycolate hydrolase [Macrophomina phaseolina MS6]|uniref:Ureidoglycolate hydrolase n=2 Tax=Macrophomina phaseolina TaxID=35725 RepID=K2RCU2_MACPH|nr:Ureidoglycolate hydrolase [Macrophomina phaseolina MS6]KAH7039081.1 ureidoglycolate hydrolase [Macrophomina phaseolina]